MSVDLKEVELHAPIKKGYQLVAVRPFKKGEEFISSGETGNILKAQYDGGVGEIRLIVKRKTKTVTTVFIEVPFDGAYGYEVRSYDGKAPFVTILPILSTSKESKEVPDEC